MTAIFDRLNKEVLPALRKCKGNKTCKDLTCRVFYFEPNKPTIEIWHREGLYKKGIDRRALFVCERPGPNNPIKEEDITVKRCWGKESANPRAIRRLERFHDVRKKYGLENCHITNIVKCSKFSGTDSPSVDEIKECSMHLIKEIEIIKPEIVVAVGCSQYGILRSRRKPFKALIESQGGKLHEITHYAFRGSVKELWERWDREFKELKGKISSSPKFMSPMLSNKETQRSKIWKVTTMRPTNVFNKFTKIVKNAISKPERRVTTVSSKDVFGRFAEIVKKVIGELDRFEPSRPMPWLCKNIFRKDDLQWCGWQGPFSEQENALTFGLNLEFTPAWRRAYPHLMKAEDELSVLLPQLKNMKWIWQGRPGRIMQNPWIRSLPQDKMWASEIDIHMWLRDLEGILNKKIIDTETNSPMRPQMQMMRLIGTSDQISDEDLIRHNIQQVMGDLQPIVELFK